MPDGPIARALEYVLLMFTFSLASTFAWWLAAVVARTEFHSLMSALACSMRFFFYSICLLCILVALRSFGLEPAHPRDPLFGWIHLGGTALVSVPCAWRAFRQRGARLLLVVTLFWVLIALAGWTMARCIPGFEELVRGLPEYLARA
jgi:hypothetical protein